MYLIDVSKDTLAVSVSQAKIAAKSIIFEVNVELVYLAACTAVSLIK